MTIQAGLSATAADQLQIHNASGYLKFATVASLAVTSTVLAAPTQNYNLVTCTTPATVTSILTTNVADGFVLVLRLGTITDTVTFTDTAVPTAGQLALAGSFSMNGADASLTLICVTQGGVTYWVELARSEASSGITMGKAIAAAIVFG